MNQFFIDLFKDEYNERRLREVYENAGSELDTELKPTKLIKSVVARNCKLSGEFIDKYFESELGNIILSYQKLDSDYLMEKIRNKKISVDKNKDLISTVLLNQRVNEKYLLELVELHESPSKAWSIISCKQELSLEFIEENLKNFSGCLSSIIFYQPKVDFQFLRDILDLENIESLSENVLKYLISSINLPSEFIRENWNYLSLERYNLSNLLYIQPRIPEDLLLQLKDLLGERAFNKRIFKNFSSSGNYSLMYSVCNENGGLILYPVSFSDIEYSFEYDKENTKIKLYKTIVDIRKIPRMKFLYKNFCEKLIEIDKNEVIENSSSVYKRFRVITPPERP